MTLAPGNLNRVFQNELVRQEMQRLADLATERHRRDVARLAQRRADLAVAPGSFPMGERWFVIYTDPSCEFRARDELVREGFPTYAPAERSWDKRYTNRNSRTIPIKERALVPRYIFSRFDINRTDWGLIRDAYGVVDLIRPNGIPMPVPKGEIEGLREREASGEFDWTKPHPERAPEFIAGDALRVTDGQFVGLNAIYKEQRPHERAAVLVHLFGRWTPTELPIDYIERL